MTTLYRVKEVSDLFVDACVRHPTTGELLYLSIYGRDGALLEFFAAFSLPRERGGLNDFTLLDSEDRPHSVYVTQPDRLEKLTGKLPKGNLFGSLGHAWLFDRDLSRPDRANRTAWGMYLTHEPDGRAIDEHSINQRLWQQVRDLSPVPLADAWCDTALAIATDQGFVQWLDAPGSLCPPLGDLIACRIELRPAFVDEISAAVRRGSLCIGDVATGSVKPTADATRKASTTAEMLPLRLGQIVVTRAVDADVPKELVMDCIRRHQMGDWGCVQADGRRLNDAAVQSGEDRILSAYAIDPTQPSQGFGDNTLWVITEWDRSVTTVLYPDDY